MMPFFCSAGKTYPPVGRLERRGGCCAALRQLQCRILVTMVGLVMASGLQAGQESLRDWILCGAFPGIGGLAGNGHRLEAHLRPSRGDTVQLSALDKRFVVAWKEYHSPSEWVSLDEEATFKKRPSFAWPRGCAYAAVYLRAPRETKATLEVRVSIGRAIVWWGARRMRPTGAITLTSEWKRLLIKLIHPRVNESGFGKPWRFRVRLRQEDGAPIEGVEAHLDDPERLSLGAWARSLTVKVRPDQPAFTFLPTEPLRLTLEFSAQTPHPAPVSVVWSVADFDDSDRAQGAELLRFDQSGRARVVVDAGPRPVGFYNLWITVRSPKGVFRRFDPFGCAVVRGPVAAGLGRRKLSSSFYWLRPDHYIEWLHRIGMTRNVGLSATWWTKRPESSEYKPGVDAVVSLAQEFGVELVGYLDGGWPASMNRKLRLKPDQLFVWFWQPLPVCGTAEYERIVRQYVRRTVARYRGRIRVWKTYNEIDRTPMPPARYAYIAKLIAEEVRAADPRARVIGASFTKPPEAYWEKVIAAGGLAGHDAIDLHCYPLYPPKFAVPCNLGGWKVHGAAYNAAVVAAGGRPRPIWWGEVGARRSLSADAAGQADFFLKMNAVGFADPDVEVVAWCDPMAAHADDFALMHKGRGASPAVCAANVAAHFLDGRNARILRQDEIQAAVFAGARDQVLAVWAARPQPLTLSVGGGKAERIDLVGRTTSLPVTAGVCRIRAGRVIQLIRARTVAIR